MIFNINIFKDKTFSFIQEFKKLKKSNIFFNNYILNNVDFSKVYHFGIVVPIFEMYETTNIFLKCLNLKINFKDIVFCFIDCGSSYCIIELFKSLNLKFNYILLQCNSNINTTFNIPENNSINNKTYTTFSLYIGNELLKDNCKILGILKPCVWLSKNYFNKAFKLTQKINMNKNILSLFNSNNNEENKTISTQDKDGDKLLIKKNMNGISLFYNKNMYEEIKYCFINTQITNFKNYKWFKELSNYCNLKNYYLKILSKSYLQNIEINLPNYKIHDNILDIKDHIYKLLKDPNYGKEFRNFKFNNDFKVGEKNLNKIIYNIDNEKLENEKLENEKLENERLENQKLEEQKLENQRLENERLENQKLEEQKLEKLEKLEKQRLEEQYLIYKFNNNLDDSDDSDDSDEEPNIISKSINISYNKNVNSDSLKKKVIFKDNINNQIIYQIINGGLGNQLFQILNIISLAYEYNLKFKIKYDNGINIIRKSFESYSFFNIISKNKIDKIIDKNIKKVYEESFEYNKLYLPEEKNILLSGYFQSFKYFMHNQEQIKNLIYIDKDKFNNVKTKLSKIKKKILGIHIRLTDYIKMKNYHNNLDINYYDNALSYFNLTEYDIMLFSDDFEKASELLKPLNIKFHNSNDFFKDDENQFIMLCLCDAKICANSSFSLMSCYFNDIFKFKDNVKCIFPKEWFGIDGPKYNIYDIIPCNKNYIILNNQLSNKLYITDNNLYLKENNKKLKIAIIFFHKNIYKLYQEKWIKDCIYSCLNQENILFDIYEINYGNEDISIFDNIPFNRKHQFFIKNYDTHTEAMLFLLKQCFDIDNYDIVFNTNLDDFYHQDRFTKQLNDIIDNDTYLNSSFWVYIDEENKLLKKKKNCIYFKNDNFRWKTIKDFKNKINDEEVKYNIIKNELEKENNVLNHSGICFSKKYWNSLDKHNNLLRYRNDKPFEDLSLWIRSIQNNIPIKIINENLIYYRIHTNSIGTQQKSNKIDKTFKQKINLNSVIIGFVVIIHNKNDLKKILEIKKRIKKDIFIYIYINENSVEDLEILSKNTYFDYKKIIFNKNNTKTNIYDIIKMFDISIINNSDHLYYIKDLNDIDKISKIDIKNYKNIIEGDITDKIYNIVHNIKKYNL
jgi:hypothetical protein